MNLLNEVEKLRNGEIKSTVEKRLKEFKEQKNWFSELCFCILTANSKAETALKIQQECDFINSSADEIKTCIIKNKHRFHNNKTKYIEEAKKYENIKQIIQNEKQPREWLVKNVKGLGYKEASHFLRNVGYTTYAILDRHILDLMGKPKTISPKLYKEAEKEFLEIAKNVNMNAAELDLYMWYLKTGKVLK